MTLALAAALLLAQAVHEEAATPALEHELRARLPELVELMRAGVERKEPYLGIPNTARFETVFDGSYDYHSCVMAHRALLALIDRTAPGGARAELSPYPAAELDELPESVKLSTVHVLGVALSTLWPHGIDGAASDAGARARFHEQYERLLAQRELWSDDLRVVSHWVPQYLWLGMWLAEGRP